MPNQPDDVLDRIMSNISIRGILFHSTTLFLLATTAVIGGAIFLWQGHQDLIIDQAEYHLTEDKIRMTPPPQWADSDLKQLVLAHPQDNSILDTQLVPRTARAFRQIGFVERVHKIEKSKSGLDIELVYRQPVALVELSEITLPKKWPAENRGKKVLLPVDRHGVLMPEAIGKQKQFPLITILFPAQFANLKTWSEWPDLRIQDAAAISGLFDPTLTKAGIRRIVTERYQQSEEIAKRHVPFQIWSGSGTRIIWGNAPGKEIEGEATATAKIRLIRSIIEQYGSLDQVNLGKIDLRSGKITPMNSAKTANQVEMFSELK